MEVKGAALLYTLAGLTITFAGLTALLLILRQAAGARASALDRYIAKTVMTYMFVLTAGALLPALLALYYVPEPWIWRGAGLLFGLPMLSLQATYPLRRRRAVGKGPPPSILAVFVALGSAATLAMLGYLLTGLPYSAAVYMTALTIDFFTVIFGFVARSTSSCFSRSRRRTGRRRMNVDRRDRRSPRCARVRPRRCRPSDPQSDG